MLQNYTVDSLELQRKKWKAEPLTYQPLAYDDLMPGVLNAIALGLHLELNVAGWVGESNKSIKDKISPAAFKSLGKNINDEKNHYDQFIFAADVYKVSQESMKRAEELGKAWEEHSAHPLEKAATSEAGVFLPSLFLLTQFGGHSLANMAGEISKDEFRHVIMNCSVLDALGKRQTAFDSLTELRHETLAFVFDSVQIDDLGIDLDFMLEQSDQLVLTGKAPELQAMSFHQQYLVPFENPNHKQY